MAETTYNWQTMSYTELSFLDKHLDSSLPEQTELRGQLHAYTAGRVKDFAEGTKLIQNAAEYKLLYGLINDASLNGSEADGGKTATEALLAFGQVKGFKNTQSGELDIYDPRCGMTADEFKAAMLKPVRENHTDFKPDGTSGQEVGDKKEISAPGLSQAAAEKMQEQMAQILNAHKMDAEAVQSMQEDMVKQAEAGNTKAPYSAPETSAEKTNEEKELEKGKTDENALGSDLAEKQLEIHALSSNSAENNYNRQLSEAMLTKELAETSQDASEWKEFAETNMVLAETVVEEKAIVTKIFEGVKEQEKNDYSAIVERPAEDLILVGQRKKEKVYQEKEAEKSNNLVQKQEEKKLLLKPKNILSKESPKKQESEKEKQEPEKEADLNIFRQIFKMAKKRKINKVKIGEDLSKEAKEKAAAAAAIEKMKVEGSKPKEINLKKPYIKELPPAEKKEIRKYNYNNMNEEERKEYKRKQKLLRKTGRVKTTKDKNIQPPQNTFINENSTELQATVTGRMMQYDTRDGGRE